jgi:hypothetical protein
MSNQNETKPFELVPEFALQKRSFLFGPGEQILDQIESSVFNKTNSGTIPKRFSFVPKPIYRNVCPNVFDITNSQEVSNLWLVLLGRKLRGG